MNIIIILLILVGIAAIIYLFTPPKIGRLYLDENDSVIKVLDVCNRIVTICYIVGDTSTGPINIPLLEFKTKFFRV